MTSHLRESISAHAFEDPPGNFASHSLTVDEVLQTYATDAEHGLSAESAAQRLSVCGRNELAEAPPPPWWKKLVAQFNELVVWVLLVAALLSGIVHQWADTIVILGIVCLNGLLGFFQESRAGKALAALRKLSAPHARVVRDGQIQIVAAAEIVPGDRLELEAGDYVLADVRLIRTASVRMDEAALTGESVPVDKDAARAVDARASVTDRTNMAWMGTVISAGKASGIVIATGMKTELGRIAGLLQQHKAGPTPLQRRLTELGRVLAIVCVCIAALVFALHLLHHSSISDAFLVSVSLAVAAVPEGLPAIVTIALAIGLNRMSRRNALVRNLPAVETLGSVTVICSDKTGTLTRNEMTVREIATGQSCFEVSGSGYVAEGKFSRRIHCGRTESEPVPIDPTLDPDLSMALTIAAWGSNASVVKDAVGGWRMVGDPTEAALIVAVRKGGIEVAGREKRVQRELPFDSDRKMMSVLLSPAPGGTIVASYGPNGSVAASAIFAKGAAEEILARCTSELIGGREAPLTERRIDEILWLNSGLATLRASRSGAGLPGVSRRLAGRD